MYNFFANYKNLDDFFETFFRGNEVEFSYKRCDYYVLPSWDEFGKVTGVLFGKKNTDGIICKTKEGLLNAEIEGEIHEGEKIEITYKNF